MALLYQINNHKQLVWVKHESNTFNAHKLISKDETINIGTTKNISIFLSHGFDLMSTLQQKESGKLQNSSFRPPLFYQQIERVGKNLRHDILQLTKIFSKNLHPQNIPFL